MIIDDPLIIQSNSQKKDHSRLQPRVRKLARIEMYYMLVKYVDV
jgi:hypothetical protein